MNITVTSPPSIAELASVALETCRLISGQPFYVAGSGVVVVVAPIPPEEAAACGGDHEFTVSTGFPPDPAAADITVWIQRRDQVGTQPERLGETDRFGSLLFTAGEGGCEYRLTLTRGVDVRPTPDSAVVLPFSLPKVDKAQSLTETVVDACPVCCAVTWQAKLSGMREGLRCGSPVCRAHLSGPKNVILAAARDGWQQNTPETFTACAQLLADLLDEQGAIRKGFLNLYPAATHNRVLNEVAGLLSTAIAVGHVLSKNLGRAAAAGRAAAVHLQSAVRVVRTYREPISETVGHPLDALLSRIAPHNSEWTQGLLEFRRLSDLMTQVHVESVK